MDKMNRVKIIEVVSFQMGLAGLNTAIYLFFQKHRTASFILFARGGDALLELSADVRMGKEEDLSDFG